MDTPKWGQAFNTGGQPVPPTDTAVQGSGRQTPVQEEDALFTRDDYPFEEPEQAPELRSERSESLYSRSEPFWNRVYEMPREGEEYPRDPNYWNHPDVLDDDRILLVESGRRGDKLKKYLGSGVVRKALIVLAILLVIGIALYSTIFQVRQITVVGNTTVPAEEIIRLSGLRSGMNTMTISEDDVSRRIENNRYLRCSLVDVKWNSVSLHVSERVPVVYINHNGMLVMLDNRALTT